LMLLGLELPFCILFSPGHTLCLIPVLKKRVFSINICDFLLPPTMVSILSLNPGGFGFKQSTQKTSPGMFIRSVREGGIL
ncbi:hypothetical protein KK466_29690, partial [Klebsiella pneumoniae]|uniref:hypothetical protein n=1 Tax=Klebsiella pneumoniae TaxID=573 RepID=UPI001BDF90C7|nr:hypothetical protein [Klebsiella pneumoniae]